MANYMDKVRLNTAVTDHSNNDLSHQHITTADFMQLNVAMTYEMSPTQKIDVKDETFARCNPLPVPTFGRASLRNRAFFVPYSTVYRAFTDYVTDTVHVYSDNKTYNLVSVVPTITNTVLCNIFLGSVCPNEYDDPPCSSDYLLYTPSVEQMQNYDYDIAYLNSDDTTYSYYVLTNLGRRYLTILEQLGYKIVWAANYTTAKPYTALPLLCLFRVYCDWYFPNQYTNFAIYDRMLGWCNYDSNGPLQLSSQDIADALRICCYVQYDSDYFTALFDNPVGPSNQTFSVFSIPDVTVSGNSSGGVRSIVSNDNSANSSSTPRVIGVSSGGGSSSGVGPYQISQYVLNSLRGLSDYMARHRLVGSKSIDRYISRWGVSAPSERINRSIYLGSSMQSVQIGDVMSTASTDGATLGDYSGKALSYGNSHWNYETNEEGLFMVLTSIVPNVGYYQGIDPVMKHIYKEDFYTPEFDNMFVEPITADALFVPEFYATKFAGLDQKVFGFAPKYYECKFKLDKVTGNFRIPTLNGTNPLFSAAVGFNAANSWHLMRVFSAEDFPNGTTDIGHNYAFISGSQDFDQYKRIFNNADPCSADNFTIIHNFEIGSVAPWKSAFDTYEFEDKGKKVTEQINGVKMN